MTEQPETPPPPAAPTATAAAPARKATPSLWVRFFRLLLLLLWIGLAGAGYFLLTIEQKRDEAATLELLNDSLKREATLRARLVEDWLTRRSTALESIAALPSLHIALAAATASSSNEAALSVADQIKIQVLPFLFAAQSAGNPAILVTDAELNLLASSDKAPNFTMIEGGKSSVIVSSSTTISGPVSIGGDPAIIISAPILKSAKQPSESLGYVMGLIPVNESLSGLLANAVHADAESYIITRQGLSVRHITPLAAPAQAAKTDPNAAQQIDSEALQRPDSALKGLNYAQTESLAYAASVRRTPWVVVSAIPRDKALAHHAAVWDWSLAAYGVVVGAGSIILLLSWRTGRRAFAYETGEKRKKASKRAARQDALIDLISDRSPNAMYILNWDHEFCYANQAIAERTGLSRHELVGRSVEAALEPDEAEAIVKANRRAASSGVMISDRAELREGNQIMRSVQRLHIPIDELPLPDAKEPIPGILVIEEDMTDFARATQRSRNTLKQLIEHLVEMVDQRDPYTAFHSESVAFIARGICESLELDITETDAAETAGRLMNIGKLYISPDILSSPRIAPSEKDRIRQCILGSVQMLQHIEFDGPVIDTLQQIQERFDGTGYFRLKGDAILITARVVCVANSFVALCSPRAYRDAQSIDNAIKQLMEGINRHYDRKVVAALVDFLDRRGGRARFDALRATQASRYETSTDAATGTSLA